MRTTHKKGDEINPLSKFFFLSLFLYLETKKNRKKVLPVSMGPGACVALVLALVVCGEAIDFVPEPFLRLPSDPRCESLYDDRGHKTTSADGCLVADCDNGTFRWRSACQNLEDILERCLVSRCLPGGKCATISFCDDANDCTEDTCDRGGLGDCVYIVLPDGTQCEGAGRCRAGVCIAPEAPELSFLERAVGIAMIVIVSAMMTLSCLIVGILAFCSLV